MFRPLLLSGIVLLFGAACAEDPGPNEAVGTLRVIIATTGANPDADNFTLTVTTQGTVGVSVNDTVIYTDLPIADYGITLGDIEGSCTVADGNPRTQYVPMGTTTEEFFVTCP